VLFCMVTAGLTADYFMTKLQTDFGITCTGIPRIRNSYSSLSYAQRSQYIQMVYSMKNYTDAWTKGQSAKTPLYNTFVQMHLNSRNAVWHYTSIFPYAHKAFLYTYESALMYCGVKFNLLSAADCCSWGLPYWPWETSYDYNTTDNVIPVLTASVFSDPDLNGDGTPDPTTGYVDCGYWNRPDWQLYSSVCSKQGGYCDKHLKRAMDYKYLNLDPSQIVSKISSCTKFSDMLLWLHGTCHNNIHIFLSYSMQTQGSPDEPMFFMHHGNIDRIYHYWANCLGYNLIDPNTLSTNQYTSINPTDPTASPPHTAKDANGNPYDTSLDATVPLFVSGENTYIWAPSTNFPTVRDLWTMGTSSQPGWNGMYYRYGVDPLAVLSTKTSACSTCGSWDWVNYGDPQGTGGNKRSDKGTEMGTPEEMLVYENLLRQFDDKVKEGMTPAEALDDLAMDSCKSNPQQSLPEKELNYLKMMGVDFSASKRICDEDITEEDLEMEKNMAMSF